ncbi:MAG: SpoIIIAH-like family protein [Firmicutes bacterium]|nr:SpoIIIAH-like family protein [Bacillota bacterium]
MKQFIETLNSRKYWTFITLVICGLLFWHGYRQAVRVSRTEIPPLKDPAPPVPREYNPGDSLLDLKIERDRERSREVERVQEILDKIGLSDRIRNEAEEELWRLTRITSKERELENLLMAKGFKECMVSIGRRLVTIAISGRLQFDDVQNIAATAAEVTGYNLDQIQIMER